MEGPRRVRPAWLVGVLAGAATLAAVLALGLAAVLIWPGNEAARGEKLGEGGARLAVVVGAVTGLVVHARRKRPP